MGFNPNEISVGRVLSNNVQYMVPRYQRKYVWNEYQWKNLVEDIIASMEDSGEDKKYHFIGSFIFEKKNDGWIIVDGQQRLTTLTILIAVISKFFAINNKSKLYEGIRKYCILTMDDGSEKMRIVNEDFTVFSSIVYDYFINPFNSFSLREFFDNEKITIKKNSLPFINCFQYFYDYIINFTSSMSEEDRLIWLGRFRDAVINLKAIEITVDKEQEGYIIFEILNSRGMPLEQHELLKNYIFMYYKDSVGSDIAKDKWNAIISNVEGSSLSSLKRFISHYITHRFGKVAKSLEYDTIKKAVPKENVKDFLDDLLFKSELYKSFSYVDDDKYTPTINYVLRFLINNNNYQFRPILLSLFEALNKDLISKEKVEKYLLSIKNFLSIYVVVCKEKTNTLENIIYDYALLLHKNFTKELMDDFIEKLFEKTDKEKFISAFSQLMYTNNQSKHSTVKRNARKECRHILFEYEVYLSQIDDYRLTNFTVEHILPDSDNDDIVCCIGNMIPLVRKLNNRLKNGDVPTKVVEYKKSPFVSVSEFIENYEKIGQWDYSDIKTRTQKMADNFWKHIWIKK